MFVAHPGLDVCELAPGVRKAREPVCGLYVAELPTFKPFTDTLRALARAIPSAAAVSVSNNDIVQVKVRSPSEAPLEGENFRFVSVGVSYASLTVRAKDLLALMRRDDVEVAQVYDFYC